MIPKAADTEEVFNNLEWEAVEDTSVSSVLEGKTIVGVELVGYPLTEGTLIDKFTAAYVAAPIGEEAERMEAQNTTQFC